MATLKEERSRKVRDRVNSAIEAQQEAQKRELQRRRIELARQGMEAYESGKMIECVRLFHTYIYILEIWKGCGDGGLAPSHFHPKLDLLELLLISSVYWDLVKIYDHARTPGKYKEMQGYLAKYILFSKGQPYQPLSSEQIRKYLNNDKAIHKSDFKNAYIALTGSKCFVATSLIDLVEDPTLLSLRVFRDDVLLSRPLGRIFVWLYYQVGPVLAFVLDHMPSIIRRGSARILDRLAKRLA
ncbi:CFI-box-CTERM domain-containing protein [Bdellovibrionota bacterium FG-2]